MTSILNTPTSLREKIFKPTPLYMVGNMMFFWALSEGMVSYLAPVLLSRHGFSNTMLGLIIASSSTAGAIFDFLVSKYMTNTHHRKVFLLFYAICLTYPFVLYFAQNTITFIFAMVIWGIYFDLHKFALFDFVNRDSDPDKFSSSFGLINIFKALGFLISPLIIGYLVLEGDGPLPFLISFLFIATSFLIFALAPISHKNKELKVEKTKSYNFLTELNIWKEIGHIIFPVMIFNTAYFVTDAFFWTIGPLFSDSFTNFKDFGGLFLFLYGLPAFFSVWWIGKLNQKFGKKRTAFVSFLIFSLFLLPVGFINAPILILVLTFIASIFISLALPSIDGAYTDYIHETCKFQKEIEGLGDFSTNMGYVLGPLVSGFISDRIGVGMSFTYLAIANIILVAILLIVTPKHIKIKVPSEVVNPTT